MTGRSESFSTWTLIGIFLSAIAAVGGYGVWLESGKAELRRNQSSAGVALKSLVIAQVDFRSNDRDGNGVNDFWTGDVAGLYYLGTKTGPGRSESMQLIPQALARADAAHPGAIPFSGYLFVAMQTDEEGHPYRQNTQDEAGLKPERNRTKFAFCAYPAEYGRTGQATWIVNEGNTIFKTDSGGRPVLAWPSDDELKRLYTKPD